MVLGEAVKWVRKKDQVSKPAYSHLHFKNDLQQKSFIGGVITILASFYIYYVTFIKGKEMLGLENPYISSLEQIMDVEKVGVQTLEDLPIPYLLFLRRGFNTIDLEEENARRFIHVRVRNTTI